MNIAELEAKIEVTNQEALECLRFAQGGGGFIQRAQLASQAASHFSRAAALAEVRVLMLDAELKQKGIGYAS